MHLLDDPLVFKTERVVRWWWWWFELEIYLAKEKERKRQRNGAEDRWIKVIRGFIKPLTCSWGEKI